MTRGLLEQALEALHCAYSDNYDGAKIHAARMALTVALAQPEAQQERKPEQCDWKPEDPDFMPGTYASACGELWSFIDGGPIENRVKFCHGCGKPVILKESL